MIVRSSSIYLWTLYRPHCEPKTGFGRLADLATWLDGQQLPGIAPIDWIVDLLLSEDDYSRFRYVHDEHGPDEWTIVARPAPAQSSVLT